jgi:uncharacterized protein YndB with AHSA1/START domain
MTQSVKKTVSVEAPLDIAFRVFTELKSWWPLDTHKLGPKKAVDAVFEPREGGRCFERDEDGSECTWGHVVVWEPPTRLVFTWEINADFKPDATLVTEVDVRFVAEGPGRTRVELEHRHLERFGERAEEIRKVFDSEGGWNGLLQGFAKVVARKAK